jgi:Tetratricopeptide repeat
LNLQPHFPQACNNLGIAHKRQDKLDEAAQWYERALRQRQDYSEAWTNLGNVRREQAHFDEALDCHDRALACDPNSAEAHFNRAQLLLLEADFARGWPEYEWRWRTPAFPRLTFTQPRWDGTDLGGRTILLHAEQGLGDTLQFVRYVPLVKARGGRVILQCQRPLLRVLAGLDDVDLLVPQGAPLPPFDVRAPLLSLPGIFGTSLETVPNVVPYLQADSNHVERWRRELASLDGFKIGIAWQGNPKTAGDKKRSILLSALAPLAQLPGVRLISLQKGPGVDQLGAMARRFPVLDLGTSLDETSGPFMDTAAVMKNLDLVITSDTAVPHLAGALGVPVWVALPKVPDWRWLLQREDSPWYPTMRLFRQRSIGNWHEVFEGLSSALQTTISRDS